MHFNIHFIFTFGGYCISTHMFPWQKFHSGQIKPPKEFSATKPLYTISSSMGMVSIIYW